MPSIKMFYVVEDLFHKILFCFMCVLVSLRSHSSSSTQRQHLAAGAGAVVAAGAP